MSVLPVLLLLVGGSLSTLASSTPSQISVDDTSPLVNYSNINDWTTHVNVASNWSLYDNTDTFSSVQGAWFLFEFNGPLVFLLKCGFDIQTFNGDSRDRN
jgi:hypothetical protein